MTGYLHLARQVRETLLLAGFPSFLAEGFDERPGFEIQIVDDGGDAGVFVNWRTSEKLLDTAVEASRRMAVDDPARQLYQVVQQQMCDTAVQVLMSAGFDAADAGGYRSLQARVSGGANDRLGSLLSDHAH